MASDVRLALIKIVKEQANCSEDATRLVKVIGQRRQIQTEGAVVVLTVKWHFIYKNITTLHHSFKQRNFKQIKSTKGRGVALDSVLGGPGLSDLHLVPNRREPGAVTAARLVVATCRRIFK